LVILSEFHANQNSDHSIVARVTAAEIDTVGFNLWRSTTKDGDYQRVNESLIAKKGSATKGAAYEFVDSSPPGSCFYKLEDIDSDGQSRWHPAVEVVK